MGKSISTIGKSVSKIEENVLATGENVLTIEEGVLMKGIEIISLRNFPNPGARLSVIW